MLLSTSGSGLDLFFVSFPPRSCHSSSTLFSSLVPLACNEKGCPTLKSLFISRVGRSLPCPIGTWHSPLQRTPQRRHRACSQLGYRTRGVLHLSSVRWCGHEKQACCHKQQYLSSVRSFARRPQLPLVLHVLLNGLPHSSAATNHVFTGT